MAVLHRQAQGQGDTPTAEPRIWQGLALPPLAAMIAWIMITIMTLITCEPHETHFGDVLAVMVC